MRVRAAGYRQIMEQAERVMEKDEPYLRRNYLMEDLARDCSTNRSYISQAVRESGERNFKTYINRRRVLKAKGLLKRRNPDGSFEYTVADVAELCGFASERSLYRIFKQFFATTPNRFRDI